MNLDHCRKDAKRLLRAVNAGDPDALARARRVLGERVRERFVLSDAQHVVANERGYRSWPVLARNTAEPGRPEPDRPEPDRPEPGRPERPEPARPEPGRPDRPEPARPEPGRPDPGRPARSESIVDTGLEYRPGDPVWVWIQRRERRVSVSDHGAALHKAGGAPGWERACAGVRAELDVNITRQGVVWLPVVAVGPSEDAVARRIGRASLIFFQELLELEPS